MNIIRYGISLPIRVQNNDIEFCWLIAYLELPSYPNKIHVISDIFYFITAVMGNFTFNTKIQNFSNRIKVE